MRVIKIENNRITGTKQVLPHYILQEGEIISTLGKLGQVANEDGTFSDYVPTQEELNAQRIEQIKVELRQVTQDIDDYTLLGDTVKVDELNVQRQALIDEYNTLK